MKKIYKTFLALAAVLTLGAVASAQDVPYLINKDHGIGYNKYIVTDPTTGDRKIRIETFATGGGERKAIPADICLVLDNSGSMLCYYAKSGTASKYKKTMTQEDVDQFVASGGDPLLIPDARYARGNYSYTYSSAGATFGAAQGSTSSSYLAFNAEGGNLTASFRYAKYNGKYYRVFQRQLDTHPVTNAAGPWYFLCFKTDEGNYMYLRDKAFLSEAPTDAVFKSNNLVIYTGDTPETVLWRAKTRMEKLKEGVQAFINEIYANDQKIAPDLEPGKVGNQIAMVAFGSNSYSMDPYEEEGAAPVDNCRIVKTFTPANSTANVEAIMGGMGRMTFLGNTSIGYGMMLANEAFRLLRNGHPEMDAYEMEADGTTYKLDDAGHPIPNRSKVVVVFTDGAPTAESAYTSIVDGHSVTNTTYAVRARAIDYSNLMKNTATGKVNAKVFAVGLNASGAAEAFLRHLSSNFPQSTYTEAGTAASDYGPSTASSNLYYMDAGAQDLKEVFQVIASIAGGTSDVGGTSMVNIDIVSKSFQVPKQAGESVASKIKVYTAQCLGLELNKTYVEDGETKHYLAFAEEVPAGTRDALDVLWVSNTNDDTGEVTWTKETQVDVDGSIDVTVEDDPSGNNDIIRVTGFDYAKFWCGLDATATHADNTKQYNVADYGNFDAGTGPYIPGYRGFKIIIDIPIALQDNAVGGPQVNTNEPGSGLLDPATGTLLIPYPRPQLVIPVNLWIQKEGLMKNENATFTIQRKLAKPTTEVPDPQYEFFTTVNVTGDVNADGTSKPVMVKLLNLDPSYYYRVVEQGWTWAYSSPAQDESTAPSTETLTSNPIVITNTPKADTPKHDEAVKRNNM